MKLFAYTNPKMLVADEGKMIRSINDNGDELNEDGIKKIIPPHYSSVIFLGTQINTMEQVQELYVEEVVIDE